MTPRKCIDRAVDVDGDMPPLAMVSSMQTKHVPRDSSPECAHYLADISDSASTTRDGSLSPPQEANNDDGDPPPEMQRVFRFIQDVAAGMDEIQSRMDKFEGVLDHLELDGLRHADEIKDLKESVVQSEPYLDRLSDVIVRPAQCERKQTRMDEFQHRMDKFEYALDHFELDASRLSEEMKDLKEFVGQSDRLDTLDNVIVRLERCEREKECLAEFMERREAEILVAAVAEAEKACRESLERYCTGAGVTQLRKACEETLEQFPAESRTIATGISQNDFDDNQPRVLPTTPKRDSTCSEKGIDSIWTPRPGPGAEWTPCSTPRSDAECDDKDGASLSLRTPWPAAKRCDKEIEAKCASAVEHYLSTVNSEGIIQLLKDLGVDQKCAAP